MKFYLAPMEGITGFIYRNAYQKVYKDVDMFITPFISPRGKKGFTPRERRDILPENNVGMHVVPQLMTNKEEDFIKGTKMLQEYGYQEVNLNLGCPSGTVVSKKRGAGFLSVPDELDRFLDAVFEKAKVSISIKTRIGMESPAEFEDLLKIYNQYPIAELIIHPRTRMDYYKNKPNWAAFSLAEKESKNPLCYNGDIFTKQDYERFVQRFPFVKAVMLGRGILANPGLIAEIHGKETDKKQLRVFHDYIYEGYQKLEMGDRSVLFKMKELWSYMIQSFENSEKVAKKIKKAGTRIEYETAVAALLKR